ncbi:MAG: hypothetical protein ATN34_02345 [Epulopiscium sp. Nele67-Bin002]|nr:MAG: hypothetical protein BEN18_02355 [Epulopiscium sp. Nuni2H_MBin001]OON90547.1 MAG: hypothetical protein ATN33_02700 [Epulopiscium sp. Nele67-Bin001]OON92466.1 MAG: hypothetical protein ATN34_02345 [Epulopiscium sp. Nele67-Bin002]
MAGAGIIAMLSGLMISLQSVFNTNLKEAAGAWCTNTLTHGVGFLVSTIILFCVRDTNVAGLKSINKLYLLGGVLGVGIVYTVIVAITKMGPAKATMIILFTQIIASYIIQIFGLFGMEKTDFKWSSLLGIGIMLVGIVVFQHE